MSFQTTLKIDVKIRGGVVLAKGDPVTVSHHNFRKLSAVSAGSVFALLYSNAHEYLEGWRKLTEDDLYDADRLISGTSITPTGESVEVDGTDKYGIPSIHILLLRT